MKTRRILLLLGSILLFKGNVSCQYAPAAGLPGSDAISASDARFGEWATGCTLQRGWQDIAQPSLGFTTVGDENSPLGRANENGVVSLGDGGIATLTFANPIFNGDGFDFAVFENAFPTDDSGRAFLEFAFVEVSSDGNHFVRFPAVSHIQDTAQLAMVGIDCSLVNNLAGKYVSGYGTPFDLEELKNAPGLDVNHITHVRIIDVVGAILPQYATYDSEGNKVNDPYPTAFPSGGFDLDAVGVIHSMGVSDVNTVPLATAWQMLPNPSNAGVVHIHSSANQTQTIAISDINGRLLRQETINGSDYLLNTRLLAPGVYFVTLFTNEGRGTQKLMVQ